MTNLKMTRTVGTAMIALACVAASAESSDRIDFTGRLMGEVQKVPNGQERLRVYLSNGLRIRREKTSADNTTEVDRDIHLNSQEKILKEKITRRTPGKILPGSHRNLLMVAFDSVCAAKPTVDCAFTFVRIDRQGDSFNDEYYLSRIPRNLEYSSVKIEKKNRFMGSPELSVQEIHNRNLLLTSRGDAVSLMVNLSEMNDVITDHKRYDGVE